METQQSWVTLNALTKAEAGDILGSNHHYQGQWNYEIVELFVYDSQSTRLPAVTIKLIIILIGLSRIQALFLHSSTRDPLFHSSVGIRAPRLQRGGPRFENVCILPIRKSLAVVGDLNLSKIHYQLFISNLVKMFILRFSFHIIKMHFSSHFGVQCYKANNFGITLKH